MEKNRIEAFTDGVYAIIITIMVLELKVPHNPDLKSYADMWPVFASYAVNFLFADLNRASHHHLFHTVTKVSNAVLWVNMLNLFVLSLVPFATAAMGENEKGLQAEKPLKSLWVVPTRIELVSRV